MANLTQAVKATKSLEQVASQVKNVALFYAPKKTGNLKRQLNSFNKPKNMVKVVSRGKKEKITLSLNIAPPGAEYGKWWNDPTVSRTVRDGKTPNVPRGINYGEKALTDKSVKKEWSKFVKEFGQEYVKILAKELLS